MAARRCSRPRSTPAKASRGRSLVWITSMPRRRTRRTSRSDGPRRDAWRRARGACRRPSARRAPGRDRRRQLGRDPPARLASASASRGPRHEAATSLVPGRGPHHLHVDPGVGTERRLRRRVEEQELAARVVYVVIPPAHCVCCSCGECNRRVVHPGRLLTDGVAAGGYLLCAWPGARSPRCTE